MSVGQWIFLVAFVALLVTMAVVKARQPYQPSRFRRALWAESVRKRGLSEEEALREAYVLGYIDTPPRGEPR